MKLLTIIFACLTGTASARLGETAEQMEKRYGKPTQITETRTFYEKDGVRISVAMWKGRCHLIMFRTMLSQEELERERPPTPRKFTRDELVAYYETNPAGSYWLPAESPVVSASGKFMAVHGDDHVMFQSMAYRAHLEKEKAAVKAD